MGGRVTGGVMRSCLSSAVLAACCTLLLSGCPGDVAPTADDGPASPVGSEASPGRRWTEERDTRPRPRPRATQRPTPAPTLQVPDLTLGLATDPVLGGDVSWPQCPEGMGIPGKKGLGLPMPLPAAEFVILGLTNGPAFTPNPCLADQVRWVRDRGLLAGAYSVSSYPDGSTLARHRDRGPWDGTTRLGALRNTGYQQARYNIRTMRRSGLFAPTVWIDVEPVPRYEWSSDRRANAAVIQGIARGYLDAGLRIGVYSTPALWEAVVGDLTLGGIPEWRAAGQTSRAEAIRRCSEDWSFQGGEAVLAQWVQDDRDLNVTCPGHPVDLFRFFHQY